MLCNLLGCVGVKEFVAPDGVAFKSAGGACAVEALYKLNQGWLVPMKGAIVYVGAAPTASCYNNSALARLRFALGTYCIASADCAWSPSVRFLQSAEAQVSRRAARRAGSKCWDVQLADILGVDLPGAHTGRRTFDVVLHAHDGSIIAELQQIDAKHLSAFEEYMVRLPSRHSRCGRRCCSFLVACSAASAHLISHRTQRWLVDVPCGCQSHVYGGRGCRM